MRLPDSLSLSREEARVHTRPFAACAATAVATLVLTELIVLDAALAWATLGLWGVSLEGSIAVGGVGALASCWAAWLLFRSTYRIERGSDHDLPVHRTSALTEPAVGVSLNPGGVARASVADGAQSEGTRAA